MINLEQRRVIQTPIYLSISEREHLEEKATKEGLKLGPFIRDIVFTSPRVNDFDKVAAGKRLRKRLRLDK